MLEKVNGKKYWNAECCNHVTAVKFSEKEKRIKKRKPKTLQFYRSDFIWSAHLTCTLVASDETVPVSPKAPAGAALGPAQLRVRLGLFVHTGTYAVIPLHPLAVSLQSFLARLAFAMFSCRFCFLFCSRSLASIIFASFQESRALAMKSGVKARMMVVRKP